MVLIVHTTDCLMMLKEMNEQVTFTSGNKTGGM